MLLGSAPRRCFQPHVQPHCFTSQFQDFRTSVQPRYLANSHYKSSIFNLFSFFFFLYHDLRRNLSQCWVYISKGIFFSKSFLHSLQLRGKKKKKASSGNPQGGPRSKNLQLLKISSSEQTSKTIFPTVQTALNS